MSDEVKMGRVQFQDGTAVELPDDAITRIAYAMTTIALTPVIQHVHVNAIVASSGKQIWPGILTPQMYKTHDKAGTEDTTQ